MRIDFRDKMSSNIIPCPNCSFTSRRNQTPHECPKCGAQLKKITAKRKRVEKEEIKNKSVAQSPVAAKVINDALHTVHRTIHTSHHAHCTIHTSALPHSYFTLSTAIFTLHCTLTIHTVNTVHCPIHISHWELKTSHFTRQINIANCRPPLCSGSSNRWVCFLRLATPVKSVFFPSLPDVFFLFSALLCAVCTQYYFQVFCPLPAGTNQHVWSPQVHWRPRACCEEWISVLLPPHSFSGGLQTWPPQGDLQHQVTHLR